MVRNVGKTNKCKNPAGFDCVKMVVVVLGQMG